jgi:hypothetical protein
MHRQGEEVADVPLLEDPQVVAALVSFATVGLELVREVWCRRRRFTQDRERWSSVLEIDVLQARAAFPTGTCHRADAIALPVLIIKDSES